MRLLLAIIIAVTLASRAIADESLPAAWKSGNFRWTSSTPLVAPVERKDDPCDAIKDPTVVFHDGRWHLFCTIRSHTRTHQIEYLSFADWKDADRAERHILTVTDKYFCAPQVFYFTPHKKWYLLYQVANTPNAKPGLLPAISTSDRVDDPTSWSKPVLLYDKAAPQIGGWIDFWIICDDTHAHLFATSNDNRLWRSETKLADFPHGWSQPMLVLKDDIFEASHTYRVQGHDLYLTLIEAQDQAGRRYYKAYTSTTLAGEWKPLAAARDKSFASFANVKFDGDAWSESISHGELIRIGVDERLEIDPARLEFLYQGVLDADRAGKPYGKIPWRLGLLKPAR